MGVSRALLLLLCLGACVGARATESTPLPDKIRAASEEWAGYTQADGQGMGWDILRAVFEPEGVKLEIRSVPYTRSIGLVQRGEMDAQVGAYRDETEGLLYPQWHYDVDHIYALGLASKPSPTLATIGNYRLVWMRGYEYNNYLPNIRRFNEIHRAMGILPMLAHDRADFYVDALMEIQDVLAKADNPQQFKLAADQFAAVPGLRQQRKWACIACIVRSTHGSAGEERRVEADFRTLEATLSFRRARQATEAVIRFIDDHQR